MLLAIINIGSSVALYAVISLSVSGLLSSYIIPLSLMLYCRVQAARGVGQDLPWGPWKLGRLGIVLNAYAVIWCVLVGFWSFWPLSTPTSVTDMNYSSLMFGAVNLFALGFWLLDGKRRYRGPVRDGVRGEIEPIPEWHAVEGKM